jgi:cysteinyl-tRNA synthetase
MKIYNTLTKKSEKFVPTEEGKVKMYVCGPTVYGPSHLGHASTYIAFDIIRRAFEYLGYDVKYVVNLTDIHDDMIKQANKQGISLIELADKNIEQYMADLEALNILPADEYPRVTEHVEDIVDTVEILSDKGFGYETEDGVYYKVSEFADYGKLSGVKMEQHKTGERIETDKYDKDTAADFALWKKSKPGEPSWDSPWGDGRPGWHIECSVMSKKYLGQPFDIHGGAVDLKFPHHENEIAQSEAAFDKKFVNYWMHAGLINVDGRKMSKSFGNFVNIPELLEKYDPMVLRYWRATVHYRSSINYEEEIIEGAKSALAKLRDTLLRWYQRIGYESLEEIKKGEVNAHYKEEFVKALENDFAMPEAVAIVWEVVGDQDMDQADKLSTVLDFDKVLGLQLKDFMKRKLETGIAESKEEEIEKMIHKRETAREEKDWQEADKIRDQLIEMGVEIEDTEDGTLWRMK